MSPMKDTQKSVKSSASERASQVWTDEERSAMKERARELKSSTRRGTRADKAAEKAADDEREALVKMAEMVEPDRAMAERLDAIIKASAPVLLLTTWYGMPAYTRNGRIICHFQPAQKFKTRYPTLGFSDAAQLDEGAIWPVAYALTELSAADEARIGELVKKAAGED
jgi:uncharacterized protein YdhG (YjbR/CyaY superfamily)